MKPKAFYSIVTRVGGQGLFLAAGIAGEALESCAMFEQLVCYGKQKKL